MNTISIQVYENLLDSCAWAQDELYQQIALLKKILNKDFPDYNYKISVEYIAPMLENFRIEFSPIDQPNDIIDLFDDFESKLYVWIEDIVKQTKED